MMNNIETFNTITGFVLADLYESFPIPIDLRAPAYAVKAGICSDPEHLQFGDSDPAASAIEWLLAEGFIRGGESSAGGNFTPYCVLTHRGLQLLSIPDSLEKKESLGTQILAASKAGSLDGVKDISKTIMCEGSKLLFQFGLQYLARP